MVNFPQAKRGEEGDIYVEKGDGSLAHSATVLAVGQQEKALTCVTPDLIAHIQYATHEHRIPLRIISIFLLSLRSGVWVYQKLSI